MKASEIKDIDSHEIAQLCDQLGYPSAKAYLDGLTIEASRWEDDAEDIVRDLKAELLEQQTSDE